MSAPAKAFAQKVFAEVTTHAAITIKDPRVLDLDRGEAVICQPFENQDALLEHLAFNLVSNELRLSSIDGWADLPDDAVTVRTFDVDVELSADG